jgi:hypothetical protein
MRQLAAYAPPPPDDPQLFATGTAIDSLSFADAIGRAAIRIMVDTDQEE